MLWICLDPSDASKFDAVNPKHGARPDADECSFWFSSFTVVGKPGSSDPRAGYAKPNQSRSVAKPDAGIGSGRTDSLAFSDADGFTFANPDAFTLKNKNGQF